MTNQPLSKYDRSFMRHGNWSSSTAAALRGRESTLRGGTTCVSLALESHHVLPIDRLHPHSHGISSYMQPIPHTVARQTTRQLYFWLLCNLVSIQSARRRAPGAPPTAWRDNDCDFGLPSVLRYLTYWSPRTFNFSSKLRRGVATAGFPLSSAAFSLLAPSPSSCAGTRGSSAKVLCGLYCRWQAGFPDWRCRGFRQAKAPQQTSEPRREMNVKVLVTLLTWEPRIHGTEMPCSRDPH
jgi:hypothetical protein